MFIISPWVQDNWIDPNKPYLIIDPDVRAETGCQYDYLTYIPVEVSGKDPSEGIRFPLSSVPTEYKEYVHYPDSWTNPLNPFNPANRVSSMIWFIGIGLMTLLGIGIVVYLILLWRKGNLKKAAKRMVGK
jgi:hypothetical protein